jgi:hypothetical protein
VQKRYSRVSAPLIAMLLSACAAGGAQPTATPPAPASTSAAVVESTAAAPTAVPTVAATATPEATPTEAATAVPTAASTEPTTPSGATGVPSGPARPPADALPPAEITAALSLPRGSVTDRPYAVMLDNHPDAYPQTGMQAANIVFEALAEYGITRYMAVFVPGNSPEQRTIGPVRSARPYYVEWAKGMRAVYVHAGGSPEGLLLAETAIELINADALRNDAAAAFTRSSERVAPHNLYTSSAGLAGIAGDSSGVEGLDQIGFVYSSESAPEARPATQSLEYFFLYRETAVGWEYDPATNSYGYYRGTRPHVDAVTGAQLSFRNVMVIEVPERPIPNDPKSRIEQQVVGSGPARLFRDGRMIEGSWRKAAGWAPLEFVNADGVEMALAPGNLWVAAVPSLANLTVSGGN